MLADGQVRLGAGRPGDGAIVFNAATIVFREGLEAVLILASLMASMKGANAKFKRPMAVGAIGAFVATGVLFVLARSALLRSANMVSGLKRSFRSLRSASCCW